MNDDGYMERSRPVIPLPDMDIPAAKTTVDLSDSITNVRITPMTTTVRGAGHLALIKFGCFHNEGQWRHPGW